MEVLAHNQLNPEFIEGAATQNAAAFLRELFPDRRIRGRSRADVLESAAIEDWEVLPDQFRRAMWATMDRSLRGAYHVLELSDAEFRRQGDSGELLQTVCRNINAQYRRDRISTDQPLEARIVVAGDGEVVLEVLYLGEAEAETADSEQNREDMIAGRKYKFKAYLVLVVPVISKITVGSRHTHPSVVTRPIHRGVTPKAELDTLQEWLAEQMGCPMPPVGDIRDGIRQLLLAGRLEPWQLDSQESDGSRVRYSRARRNQNESSRQAEEIIKAWETHKGRLVLDNQYSFAVDTSRAIFSFGAGVDLAGARNVIHTVLGAAG